MDSDGIFIILIQENDSVLEKRINPISLNLQSMELIEIRNFAAIGKLENDPRLNIGVPITAGVYDALVSTGYEGFLKEEVLVMSDDTKPPTLIKCYLVKVDKIKPHEDNYFEYNI